MFEILTGFLPFGGELNDPYEIYKEILDYDGEIDDIEEIQDETAVDLIQKLLTKEPGVRFNGSHAKIQAHEYFNGFDWVYLILDIVLILLERIS